MTCILLLELKHDCYQEIISEFIRSSSATKDNIQYNTMYKYLHTKAV